MVCIGTRDVKWMPHDEVVGLIREAGNTLNLTLVTPCDKTYYKLPKVSILNVMNKGVSATHASIFFIPLVIYIYCI